MATSTLMPTFTYTPTNGVQATYTTPSDAPADTATVTSYVATAMTLPGLDANGAATAVTLPIPASWDRVTQTCIQNTDPSNYAVLLLNGESAVWASTFAGNVVLGQTFDIAIDGQVAASYTAVSAAPTAQQFIRGATLALSAQHLATAIAANLPANINSVLFDGTDTIYFTSPATLDTSANSTWSNTCAVVATQTCVLLAPGQVFAFSSTAVTSAAFASVAELDPRLLALYSADSTGAITTDVTCAVSVYAAGS